MPEMKLLLHLSVSKRNGNALCTEKATGNSSYRHTNCKACQIKFGKSRGKESWSYGGNGMMQMRGVSINGSAVR